MARGVNKVILIGNLGADPETRAMPSGAQVANLRIATTENWKDRTSGENQERTEWHRVALFGKLAEIAGEYLRKGSQVYIEGSLRTRKWQDKQGNERFSTEIIGNEMQMLGGRGGGAPSETRDSRDPGAESFEGGRGYANESRGGGGGGGGSGEGGGGYGSRGGGGGGGGEGYGSRSAGGGGRQAPPSDEYGEPSSPPGGSGSRGEDFDDDIPF